jgi:predicted GNAT superfamily acetyltransferase
MRRRTQTHHASPVTHHDVITIRDLNSLQDYADCVALQDETWGAGFSERVPMAILRVSQIIGGVTAGAFDENGKMVGFVFGMTGVRENELVHWSDMLAVRDELRGQGIGERLKQFQREKVLALGVKSMLWTFDPLQAKNAHFNINHLGAFPIEYITDMYGSHTGSLLHGVLPTDRFIVRWGLDEDARRPGRNPLPIAGGNIPVANPIGADGLPSTAFLPSLSAHAGPLLVQVPADFAAVQKEGRSIAMRWRLVIREIMTAWLSAHYRVTAFQKAKPNVLPFYRLDPPA